MKEQEAAEQKKRRMNQDIEDDVNSLITRKDLVNHQFYIGHLNYTVITDEGEYYPCEIAVLRFSLQEGATNFYHSFINPGELRVGYSFEAKQNSEKTHKIPTYGFDLARSDYSQIIAEIQDFICQGDGRLEPIYFETQCFEGYEYMLNYLIERSSQNYPQVGDSNGIQIRSLNKLFYELRKQAKPSDPFFAFPSISFAGEMLWKKRFDFYSDLACQWHDEQDASQYCSLSIVRRFAYFVSDLCCGAYGVQPKPGRHFPADTTLDPVPASGCKSQMVGSQALPEPQDPRLPRLPTMATSSRIAARFSNLQIIPKTDVPVGSAQVAPETDRQENLTSSSQAKPRHGVIGRGIMPLFLNKNLSSEGQSMEPIGRGRGRGVYRQS